MDSDEHARSTLRGARPAPAVDELRDQAWSAPLLAGIRDNGGITQANKDRMFELRLGDVLDRAGVIPQYEIPGEGQSTIDFGFTNEGQRWRVEMVRLGETQAVKDATGFKRGCRRHPLDEPVAPHRCRRPEAIAGGRNPQGGAKNSPEMRV